MAATHWRARELEYYCFRSFVTRLRAPQLPLVRESHCLLNTSISLKLPTGLAAALHELAIEAYCASVSHLRHVRYYLCSQL